MNDRIYNTPSGIGHKEDGGTSEQAAAELAISGRAVILRNKVRNWYAAGHTGTADDCANAIGENILSVRPRVSELRASFLLEKTGERHISNGGKAAAVWRWRTL
jgi:hypothetical protein